jgi:SAM-dependent methyltransferase
MEEQIDEQVGTLDEASRASQQKFDGMLPVYDLLVLLNNRLVWRSPTANVIKLYNDNVSARHLDAGVGTGYLLHHCRFPTEQPELALLDLSARSLLYARKRLARYTNVKLYRRNIVEPLNLGRTYQSVGLGYLLHCVPEGLGSQLDRILANVEQVLEPGGVVFGATFFREHAQSLLSRRATSAYERRGIFLNPHASFSTFRDALGRRFDAAQSWQQGAVTFFRAVRRAS